ncbi:MAG TPA: TetR family transcriptional regulator [Acidimicrobiales bacterium]|jgi:AcrR family transcriptional regulator
MNVATRTSSGWDIRRRDTTDRLAQVAHELFVLAGYANVSVEEIAAAGGVSARTFHRYFPSKQDVLLMPRAMMDRMIIDRLEKLGRPRSPLREIRDVFIQLTEEAADLAPFVLWRRAIATAPDVEARASEEGRQRLMRALRRVFADWLGVDPEVDVRPDAMSSAVIGVNAVAVNRYLASNGTTDLGALFVEAFECLERGFGPR